MTASDVATVATQIETFIRSHFRVAPRDTRFSRRAPLFDLGYVDSVGVVELIDFISRSFHVKVPDDVLLADEFATIDGMAEVITRLQAPQGGAQG